VYILLLCKVRTLFIRLLILLFLIIILYVYVYEYYSSSIICEQFILQLSSIHFKKIKIWHWTALLSAPFHSTDRNAAVHLLPVL